MIIINNEVYILDPTDVSTVVANKSEIVINMKGGGYLIVSSQTPYGDSYKLTQAIFDDISAGGVNHGNHITIRE